MAGSSKTQDQDDLAYTLLKLIEELLHEMHPEQSHSQVLTLDSSLDDDIGLDSLARVELITRIEQRFKLTLPQRVFTEVESPRDLLQEIGASQGQQLEPDAGRAVELKIGKIEALPQQASTLVDVLEWHVQHNPDRTHIRFADDDVDPQSLSYRALWQGAEQVAAGLQQKGLQVGETVAIMLPTGPDYFFSFFGILLTGAIPVPIYPPVRRSQLEDHLQRHSGILKNCLARLLITIPEAKVVARLLQSQVPSLGEVVTVSDLRKAKTAYIRPSLKSDDIAFLQYTSGSTGNPKGVVLTHANLLANIRTMGKTVAVTPDDVFISWLPLYHDMGLIGAWLGSMYFAMLLVVMSPLSFLSRPQRWLWAIHEYRGTLSASPNFGYELCLKRLDDKVIEGLDLSCWRLAFNGAEAVSPGSIEAFSRRFGDLGFRAEAMMPVYGLAESSVGLAFPPLQRKPIVDRISRDEFSRNGHAIIASPTDINALSFVACGHALTGHQIRIVDRDGKELPEREQGRLQFRGPSATSGYYRNPQQTQQLFDGEWLESGDLAYKANGDIFITGRIKDLIIRGGRNIYPPELEEMVGKIDGIRDGCVAVFGAKDQRLATERLVVLAETRETDDSVKRELQDRIRSLSNDLIGMPPDEIIIAAPHTVLKTSSGKIRRSTCRELYEQNQLGQASSSFWLQITRAALRSVLPEARRLWQKLVKRLYAAYVWILFVPLALIAWLTVMLLPSRKLRWRMVHGLSRFLVFASGIKITVQGLEKLPPESQLALFVANHASYIDSFVIVASLPRDFSFIAKGELKRNIFTASALKRIGTEFVERFDKKQGVIDAQAIANVEQRSQSLFFFPEGTFTGVSGLRKFHMGAFITAAKANLPVVPVAIRGTRSILRAETWAPVRGQIALTIGETISVDQSLRAEDRNDWRVALKLRQVAQQHILAHSGEVDLSDRSL